MQGEKVDPEDDQSGKDQSGDQTGQGSLDSVLNRSRSSDLQKTTQQVSSTHGPAEDCKSQDEVKQRTVVTGCGPA